MRKLFLSAVLLMMPSAFAGVLISDPTVGVVSSGFGTSGVTRSVTNVALGSGASGSGTACFAPFCPGGSTPGAGPDYEVLDPVTFRFTNVAISCNIVGCANLNFRAAFSFVATSSGVVHVGVGMEGSSTANVSGLISGFIGNGSSFVAGNQTFTTSVSAPSIHDSFELGNFAVEQGQTIRGYLLIQVETMSRGVLSFPDSVTMTLVDVPEPATLGFLTLGIAALGLARISRKA
ncbi:MAG: PEP-CTERM sorting domain-containing protein [Bryobacteraceae bacterium]